ncbi:hypothetical protein SAMN02910356_00014 [Selenomonas sp. GACV-9]|uniref:hypothetical protein n=1 Tax=Selenomonas sp. GACV-9 TaxID=3158782 RepID=UPI0008ED9866|nr:hypothetical protein SAMN02910356_00014 [Selenomonas ruminantium]
MTTIQGNYRVAEVLSAYQAPGNQPPIHAGGDLQQKLAAEKNSYENQINQLTAADSESNAAEIANLQAKVESIDTKLSSLLAEDSARPSAQLAPPSDAEMNRRFGQAAVLDLSPSAQDIMRQTELETEKKTTL